MKIKIREGTPNHGKSLCRSCSNAMIMRGGAVSEKTVLCTELKGGYGRQEVPYEIIVECSAFQEKAIQSLYEMQKIAYILKTDVKGKPIGFIPNRQFRVEEKKDGEDHPDITPGY